MQPMPRSGNFFVAISQFGTIFLVLVSALLTSCATPSRAPLTHVVNDAADAVYALADERHSLGSGFFVSRELLLTSHHVKQQGQLFLLHADGSKTLLERVSIDDQNDLALYRALAFSSQTHLSLSSTTPLVGESVVALGNPFGIGIAASAGIVSALPHRHQAKPRLQTDAAVNSGNSGGPLLNAQGKVIGMISDRGAVGTGIGFAIPAPILSAFLASVDQ